MPAQTARSDPAASTVAVVDPVPVARRGLAAALADAGFRLADPPDLVAWLGEAAHPMVVVTFRCPDQAALAARVHAADDTVPLVGLVTADCPEEYRQALQAGVCAAACVDAPVEALVELVDAACRGWAMLPPAVLRMLARAGYIAPEAPELTPPEVALLRALASGTPVEAVARAHGCSERVMYRQLRRLRSRLGATCREDALVRAARWGLLP